MKKLIVFILVCNSIVLFAQKEITAGIYGSEFISTVNANFDTVFNKIGSPVSVKEYGAKGDGVTNDAVAINAALAAAKGRRLHFPQGTYIIESGININTDSAIYITGDNATIQARNLDKNTTMIGITGTQGVMDSLTSDAKVGDYYLTVTDASLYKQGDILYITDDYSFGGLYTTGEHVMVFGNNGDDSIRLMTPLIFPFFISENAKIRKMSSNPVIITGLKIIGQKILKLSGIGTINRSNVKIYNNEVSKCIYAGIVIDHGMNAYIFNNKVFDSWYGVETIEEYPGGDNYGISIASFRQVEVYENNVYEARHCIETGGYQACMEINIHNNNIYSTIGATGIIASISSHLMDAYITIKNNIIYGDGINARGRSLNISGNKLYITEPSNLGIKILSERGFYIEDNNIIVKDNEINNIANKAGQYGIYFYIYANDTINNFIVEGNTSSGMQSDFIMSSHDTSSTVIENMIFTNNQFRSKNVLYTDLKDSITVVEKLIIDNNVFYSGIRILGDTTHYARITDNIFDMKVNANPMIINQVGNILIDRNNINVNGRNTYISVLSCGDLRFTNNEVKNSTATNPVVINGVVNLINNANSIVNSNAISLSNITNDLSGGNYTY